MERHLYLSTKILKRLINLTLPFTIRVIAALGSAALAFALANSVPAKDVGNFYFVLTVCLGLSIVARNGLERSIVRFLPHLEEDAQVGFKNPQFVLLWFNIKRVVLRSLVIVAMLGIVYCLSPYLQVVDFYCYVMMIPLISLNLVISGFNRGTYRPSYAILFEIGVLSLISSGLIVCIKFSDIGLTLNIVFICFSLSALLILCFYFSRTFAKLYNSLKEESIKNIGLVAYDNQIKTNNSFMTMTLAVFAQQLVIVWVLGVIIDPAQLAVYKISEKIAVTIAFFQSVIVAIYAPYFSKYANSNEIEKFIKTYTRSLLLGIALALPPFIFILLFSDWLLTFFGNDFAEGGVVLVILALAQLNNVIYGQAGLALNMSGNEKDTKLIIVLVAVISIPVTYFFSVELGIVGAAISVFVSAALNNISCLSRLMWLRKKERLI